MVVLNRTKETNKALNDSLDDNEEVYSTEAKEESKDIESQPCLFYFVVSSGKL